MRSAAKSFAAARIWSAASPSRTLVLIARGRGFNPFRARGHGPASSLALVLEGFQVEALACCEDHRRLAGGQERTTHIDDGHDLERCVTEDRPLIQEGRRGRRAHRAIVCEHDSFDLALACDEHRAGCAVDHARRDRTEDARGQRSASAAADHDEISFDRPCPAPRSRRPALRPRCATSPYSHVAGG